MKQETVFKIGDKVFDIHRGWGLVVGVANMEDFSIAVDYGDSNMFYTEDGRVFLSDKNPTLSFTEYTLQGFSQERP